MCIGIKASERFDRCVQKYSGMFFADWSGKDCRHAHYVGNRKISTSILEHEDEDHSHPTSHSCILFLILFLLSRTLLSVRPNNIQPKTSIFPAFFTLYKLTAVQDKTLQQTNDMIYLSKSIFIQIYNHNHSNKCHTYPQIVTFECILPQTARRIKLRTFIILAFPPLILISQIIYSNFFQLSNCQFVIQHLHVGPTAEKCVVNTLQISSNSTCSIDPLNICYLYVLLCFASQHQRKICNLNYSRLTGRAPISFWYDFFLLSAFSCTCGKKKIFLADI